LVGNAYQHSSISAAVLGGVDLFGGRGTVWGAIAGALVLAMIGNVLNLLGVVAYWQWIVQGLILLLAVALYAVHFGHRRSAQPA
jgi:ribose transport system permease protein